MNWENNFYRIIQVAEGDNGFNSTVELMEKHPIYEGHFPFESIVPGVCTLAIKGKQYEIIHVDRLGYFLRYNTDMGLSDDICSNISSYPQTE